MKTIKIIDLLNKIANVEEAPKKIRFDNIEWNKVYGEKNVYYINEYDSDFFLYFFRKNLDFTLNEEVEIIEEDKKIEEIKIDFDEFYKHYNIATTINGEKYNSITNSITDKILCGKINEIIDYINKDEK